MTRHHRHRYVAPSGGNAATVVVILCFVAAIGVGVYFVMRPSPQPEPLPPLTLVGNITPLGGAGAGQNPAPPAPPPPSASPGRAPEGVTIEPDARKDRVKVIARGIPLSEDVTDVWKLDVSWTNSGRVPQKPSSPILWSVVHRGPQFGMKEGDRIDLRAESDSIQVGATDYGSDSNQEPKAEALRFSTSWAELVRISQSSRASLRAGTHDFDLTGDGLARLRALVSTIP